MKKERYPPYSVYGQTEGSPAKKKSIFYAIKNPPEKRKKKNARDRSIIILHHCRHTYHRIPTKTLKSYFLGEGRGLFLGFERGGGGGEKKKKKGIDRS